jgi:membrane protein DedA with SNARE-associated domain
MDSAVYGLSYVEHLSYIGFFVTVGLSGYLIPIPEEVILILAGYLAAYGAIHFQNVAIACILGAVCGDMLIYYLSSHGNKLAKKYQSRVEKSQAGWYLRHMRKDTMLTIFFSRFIVGMRFLNPVVSGLLHVKAKKFLVATSVSAIIYVPLIIFVGYHFHTEINTVLRVVHSVRNVVLVILLAGSVVLVYNFFSNLIQKNGA